MEMYFTGDNDETLFSGYEMSPRHERVEERGKERKRSKREKDRERKTGRGREREI